jgi:hypothetical protein
LSTLPALSFAGNPTPAEKAFFSQHVSDVIKLDARRLDAPAIAKVFSSPVYLVKVVRLEGDGEEIKEIAAARVGEKLVSMSVPGTDSDLPNFEKMLSPAFRLRTDADAVVLQEALDAVFPITMDRDRKVKAFRRAGNQWSFLRGEFFEDKLGYLFETDATGAVKSVKYRLRLP